MGNPLVETRVCGDCRGTGWKAAAGGVVRCDCQLNLRDQELWDQAGIPARYQNCIFDEFKPPEGARELQLAHIRAKEYGRLYPGADRKGLLLFGPPGVGKTHLAVAIAHQLLDRGFACRFVDHRDLLKRIQATFDPNNPATEAGVVAPLLEVEVLILDDLGVGRATDWAIETLHYILNHRYSHTLATLVTTNLEDGEAREVQLANGSKFTSEATLVGTIGPRLRSRLYEMCDFVAMHGDDYRRKNAAAVVR